MQNGEESNKISDDIDQGKLYFPDTAIRIQTQEEKDKDQVNLWNKGIGGVAADIRRNFTNMKERLMEKLAAPPVPVPAEALENARLFVESLIKDVTAAAQGMTKDALQKLKNHLAEIIPSLSPQQTTKMVDEAERETMGGSEEKRKQEDQRPPSFMFPASSTFSLIKSPWTPRSKL
ncbi:hypothetical protein AMTR_s00025p00231150 [Amborella trichopoda]|uniref:Uncharacterized protein n=2 Tax=Amborella trichopoda TaxID=13333 RepID=W1PXL0_AMBTC|nr:hypothetical protein AMTR_s00025p00231150 [Amborella trichopoda]